MKKERDKTIFPTLDDHMKSYFGGWIPPGSFAPVPLNDSEHSRRPFILQSHWECFTAWLRYYSIQIRWDIERWLARKLHRRWL